VGEEGWEVRKWAENNEQVHGLGVSVEIELKLDYPKWKKV